MCIGCLVHFSVIPATEVDSSLAELKFTFPCGLDVSTFIKHYKDYMKCLKTSRGKSRKGFEYLYSPKFQFVESLKLSDLCFKIYEKSLN